jgi:hypothetical protein
LSIHNIKNDEPEGSKLKKQDVYFIMLMIMCLVVVYLLWREHIFIDKYNALVTAYDTCRSAGIQLQ